MAVRHISGRPTEISGFHRKNHPLIIVVWREFDRAQDWVLTGLYSASSYKVGHEPELVQRQ